MREYRVYVLEFRGFTLYSLYIKRDSKKIRLTLFLSQISLFFSLGVVKNGLKFDGESFPTKYVFFVNIFCLYSYFFEGVFFRNLPN